MPTPKKSTRTHGTFIRLTPDPPDIQDVLDEIASLKETVRNTLDAVIAIKKSIAELQREVSDLSDRVDQ